jgi:hypothetical protein
VNQKVLFVYLLKEKLNIKFFLIDKNSKKCYYKPITCEETKRAVLSQVLQTFLFIKIMRKIFIILLIVFFSVILSTKFYINKEIKNQKIGIETEGKKIYFIYNCNIHNNTKGIYATKGTILIILNSKVEKNKEEGIDIRENTKILIANNTIKKNGESGIETESDGVKVLIYKNEITENQTQGVTIQYRAGQGGKVKIRGNKIENNKKFNLNCNAPNTPYKIKGYYKSVMDIDEIENISNKCYK